MEPTPEKYTSKYRLDWSVEIWRTDPLRSGLKYQATLSLIPHGTLSLTLHSHLTQSRRQGRTPRPHARPPATTARPPGRRPGPPAPPAGPARRRPRPRSPFPAAPPARRTRLEAALLAVGRARPPVGPLPRSSARRCPNPRQAPVPPGRRRRPTVPLPPPVPSIAQGKSTAISRRSMLDCSSLFVCQRYLV